MNYLQTDRCENEIIRVVIKQMNSGIKKLNMQVNLGL